MSPIRCSLLQRDIPGKRLKQLQTRASLAHSLLRTIRSPQCPYGRVSEVSKTNAPRVPRDDRDSSQSTRSDASKYSRKGMTPMSNEQKGKTLVEISRQGPDTPLAHRRPRYPLTGCFPAEPASVSLGEGIAPEIGGIFQPLDIGAMP